MSGDETRERLRLLRAFGTLRKALRATTSLDRAAAEVALFVVTELRASRCVLLFADRDDADFSPLADSEAQSTPVAPIARGSSLLAALEAGVVELPAEVGTEAVAFREGGRAVACRHDHTLVGVILLSGPQLDADSLEELAAEVGYLLWTARVARGRQEELAVLEVQERELVSLLREVQERDAIIRSDLEEACAFQRMMLGAIPSIPGLVVDVFYRPLDMVGGDLYALSFEEGILRAFVADATGHGVRAALTTMFIKNSYETVRPHARGPAELLALLNEAIAGRYASAEMLFSAACLDLNLETGEVRYASAGNPPLCVVREGKSEAVGGGEALLGLRTRVRFSSTELRISRRDGLYLLTDGLSEARSQSGEILGDERLHAVIAAAHEAGAGAVGAAVAAAESFTKTPKLADDATVIGIRFGETGGGLVEGAKAATVPVS